jgi:hypothetical protein
MLLSVLFTLAGVVIALAVWQVGSKFIQKRGKAVIFQWGEFTNFREGIQNSPVHEDESKMVPYQDFKYWIRLHPNKGFNLPGIGYWSQFRGRRR